MKQVLSIVLSVTIFSLSINVTNSIGIALTLVGGACYTVIEMRNRKAKALMVKTRDADGEDGSVHEIERSTVISLGN
jgi:hypothetical protein